MKAWLRQTLSRLNASYWFLPALLTLAAILLSVLTHWIDRSFGHEWLSGITWLHDARPDGARALLSTISGSMISVAGTVFAITIAAVVYASGNYGPRLLTNFMTDKGNQLTLGVFIATFVYCLLVLRTVRQPDEAGMLDMAAGGGFVPQVSLLVSFALALLSVAVLVYFLHHVPDSIRINRVVATIGTRALRAIESRFPDPDCGEEPVALEDGGTPVRAKRVGYVEVIDFATLEGICKAQGIGVRLAVRPGDFVHPDVPLLHVSGSCGDQVPGQLRGAFAIGWSRTADQDLEYLLDELVEIALRALSPGINDPFTAITCLHWLSAATASLATRDLRRDADGDPSGDNGVQALPDDFAHFMQRGFGAVRASAASNHLASLNFLQALESVAAGPPSSARIALLQNEARRLLAQAETELAGPALEELRERVAAFAPSD
ncbi:DUF2254 domain-containing protein [Stakelama tenebrarum]|uniref:DUF2254 domain-containing protein n=1 Tax=Stakelama tenebrarum TaxID=2711215 RepID=A0A6G6Y8E6_9SPHN|nr:DUF2254 domain-containing protein [Sphingosinithalassobacter tenebrarum]QIG81189.1 DUF2254 domain-containing protein [Sphingosinithalassobacter tenebrarum]